ncbi:MAG: L,D-transpeptidase family protein [Planctomycetota bacterium]
MTLSSQSPRPGLSRQYMSRKRRGRPWKWVLLAIGGLILAGVYYWLSRPPGESSDAQQAGATTPVAARAAEPTPDPRVFQPVQTAEPDSISPTMPPPLPPRQGRTAAAEPDPPAPVAFVEPEPEPEPEPETAEPTPEPSRAAAAVPPPSGYVLAEPTPDLRRGMDLIANGRLIDGRRVLSPLILGDRSLPSIDAATVRDTLASINQKLVFSGEVLPGDPAAEYHTIQRGDMLARLAPSYRVPYPFVARINDIDPARLQVGQQVKFVKGPFHARVVKDDYRMDMYVNGDDGQPLYICSFPVGLGEFDSTPIGEFVVERGRKVQNPGWADPRTGKYYQPDDPDNPIGEHWIALRGTSPSTENLKGYGIHGTIEPSSIGSQASMGCIRLRDEDVELVYHMLAEGHSTVEIVR